MLPDRAFLTRKYAEILEQMRMADEQEKREREREEREKVCFEIRPVSRNWAWSGRRQKKIFRGC